MIIYVQHYTFRRTTAFATALLLAGRGRGGGDADPVPIRLPDCGSSSGASGNHQRARHQDHGGPDRAHRVRLQGRKTRGHGERETERESVRPSCSSRVVTGCLSHLCHSTKCDLEGEGGREGTSLPLSVTYVTGYAFMLS